MKILITFLIFFLSVLAQQTVTDFDGNIYETITIGEQVWLNENLKSLHYSDGTEIPGVVAYNNDDSLETIYGLLYSWNAAMNGSNVPGTQGVCPCSTHLPTDQEWTILENYLGGPSVAGGGMKEAGTDIGYHQILVQQIAVGLQDYQQENSTLILIPISFGCCIPPLYSGHLHRQINHKQ